MSGTPTITDARVLTDASSPAIHVVGTGEPPVAVSLEGARLTVSGPAARNPEGGWTATVPLLASRWGGPALPSPSGAYRLSVAGAATLELPVEVLIPEVARIRFARNGRDELTVHVSAPLADDEVGPENQARLANAYATSRPQPETAVFFESYFGQTAGCNPLAIDRALAEARPDVTRYWGVSDASVAVPPGAIRVIEGSAEWWRVRGAVRLIVINDWLRRRYRKRRHQTVLQTWHGTMLKRLALSRRGFRPRADLATLRERRRWSIVLSQNPFSTRVFRRSYAWFGPVWEEGYPRDDRLTTGDAAEVRERLGLSPDARVVLYAPTWRDDSPDRIDHLDVERFAAALGPDTTVLIRGHSRTLQPGRDLHAAGVIDVTTYPDVSDLFLAADALVTDYSSVMFDFSVTGKPIFFFTPDLEHYRDRLRGFYFDLLETAPGPIITTPDDLIAAINDTDAIAGRYAERYAAWRARFNPHDDGRAADRAVARILAEGIL